MWAGWSTGGMTVGKAQAGIPAAVSGYGNVLACVASIWGLSVQERSVEELDLNDPRFPLVACAHAEKPR